MADIFDDRPCELGEGPLWHPERRQLFWFDILNRKLMTRTASGPSEWILPDLTSAAGWTTRDVLFLASESGFSTFDVTTGQREQIAPLEVDNLATRSNDGRADPWGGFWIGTMGKKAEPGAGAIYRYYRGEVRQLYAPIRIPNSISFTPDRRFAHFSDTPTGIVRRTALDETHGWPKGDPEPYLDFAAEGREPDGAVCDAQGNLWVAQWGSGRVACHAPDGHLVRVITVGGRNSSCPAFGDDDLSTLYVTTAREHLSPDVIATEPQNGCTFAAPSGTVGLPPAQVIL